MWKVRQTRSFARIYKKLHDNVVVDVDVAIASIQSNPDIGNRKKGDLAHLYVHKFRSRNHRYLLGYTRDDASHVIYLETVSSHENFYKNLKRLH